MTVSDLLEEPCNKSDNINKVVTISSCLATSSKLADNLKQAGRTQLVDGLFATRCEIFACEYICVRNRLVASLSTSCNNYAVISSSSDKLLNCRTITSSWNNL